MKRRLLLVLLAACAPAMAAPPRWQVEGGDAQRGRVLVQAIGCVHCHTIPGVPGADGNVGPPLLKFGDRTFIAGMLRNDPANLVRWIRHPQTVVPGNAMPDMGIDEQQARDIAAFLYTLR